MNAHYHNEILDDEISSFADMFGRILDITNLQRIIQVLTMELFKITNNSAPQVVDYMFTPLVKIQEFIIESREIENY